MKLPNLRLAQTQATWSFYIGILALISMLALAFFVFKGFDLEAGVIPYNAKGERGQYRPALVYAATAACFLSAFIAGLLGFKSLGEKRNDKQGNSWLGLVSGAMCMALSPVMLYAWEKLSEAAIVAAE